MTAWFSKCLDSEVCVGHACFSKMSLVSKFGVTQSKCYCEASMLVVILGPVIIERVLSCSAYWQWCEMYFRKSSS